MATKRLFFSCVVLIALTGSGTELWGQTAGFAYVVNCGGFGCQRGDPGNVSAYSIDGTTGALTTVAGSPFPAGNNPVSVAVDPTGQFAYVALAIGNVWAYTIDRTTGALTRVGSFPAGSGPASVTVDPTGQFVYVANSNSVDVSGYTIDSTTGALTPVAGSPFSAGSYPKSVTVDPTGRFVYVANGGSDDYDGYVSSYRIDGTTGALTPVGAFSAGSTPQSVTVDPTGRFAYVANSGFSLDYPGNVWAYTIDGITGTLTPVGSFPAGEAPISVTVDPTGQFAYVAALGIGFTSSVSAYTIGTTGALTPVGSYWFGLTPISVTVDPTGQFVYVANHRGNDVSAFIINGVTGALTFVGNFPAGSSPSSVTTTAGPPARPVL